MKNYISSFGHKIDKIKKEQTGIAFQIFIL